MIFYCGLMVHITDTRTQKVVSYTAAHIVKHVYEACALGNIEKVSCFLYLLQFENTTSIRQTKIEYV